MASLSGVGFSRKGVCISFDAGSVCEVVGSFSPSGSVGDVAKLRTTLSSAKGSRVCGRLEVCDVVGSFSRAGSVGDLAKLRTTSSSAKGSRVCGRLEACEAVGSFSRAGSVDDKKLRTTLSSVKGSSVCGRLEKRNVSRTGETETVFRGEGISCPRSRWGAEGDEVRGTD